MIRYAIMIGLCLVTSGCIANHDDLGRVPQMSSVGEGLAHEGVRVPIAREPLHQPVSTGSIWQDTSADLFRDPRARRIGDTVTVKISISDEASLDSKSDRSREATRDFSFGLDYDVGVGGLSRKGSGSGQHNISSESTHTGEGQTSRSEKIDLVMAAVVTQVLPNGNLVVRGSQEVRVNYEVRILTVAGIVRQRDIEQDNSVSYDKIAEARISYGGRGRISEVQQPGLIQQLMDIITPF